MGQPGADIDSQFTNAPTGARSLLKAARREWKQLHAMIAPGIRCYAFEERSDLFRALICGLPNVGKSSLILPLTRHLRAVALRLATLGAHSYAPLGPSQHADHSTPH